MVSSTVTPGRSVSCSAESGVSVSTTSSSPLRRAMTRLDSSGTKRTRTVSTWAGRPQ